MSIKNDKKPIVSIFYEVYDPRENNTDIIPAYKLKDYSCWTVIERIVVPNYP